MEDIEQLKQDNAKLTERLNNAAKFFKDQKAQIDNLTKENKQLKDQNIEVPEQVDEETVNFLNELKVKFIKQFLIEELSYENEE